MAIDTLIAYVGVYANVEDAERRLSAVKDLHRESGLIDAYDAAVVERRDDGKVKIGKKHETPTRVGGVPSTRPSRDCGGSRRPPSSRASTRISSGKLESVVTVGNANAKELSAVTATDAALSSILNETGGGSFWLGRNQADASPLPRIVMVRGGHVMHGADWLGLHKRDAYHVQGVRLFPLFTGFLALALLLGMMAITWFREGH